MSQQTAIKNPTFIVLLSKDYGGAELRFFDIFTSLRDRNENIFLISSEELCSKFKDDYPERNQSHNNLITFKTKSWSRIRVIVSFWKLLRTLPQGSTFHYPFNYLWPLHIFRRDTVVLSLVDCHTSPGLLSFLQSNPWFLISALFAAKLDILRPTTWVWLKSFSSNKELTLTPGGTYQLGTPKTAESTEELNLIYFSRLEVEKGITDWLSVLGDVNKILLEKFGIKACFTIAGYGTLGHSVETKCKLYQDNGINVRFIGRSNADTVFHKFGIFLSVQRVENYPSRIVAEALTRGCPSIISRVGDSEQFPKIKNGIVYIDPKLDPVEIAVQTHRLFSNFKQVDNSSEELAKSSKKIFSGEITPNYYLNFYGLNENHE